MKIVNLALAGAVAALIGAPIAALSTAQAQQTAQSTGEIMLSDKDIPWEYTELGTVSAVFHKKALISKLDPEEEVNKSLRKQAAALGADAVVLIKYDPDSPFNKKGFTAEGRAIKFTVAPQEEERAALPGDPIPYEEEGAAPADQQAANAAPAPVTAGSFALVEGAYEPQGVTAAPSVGGAIAAPVSRAPDATAPVAGAPQPRVVASGTRPLRPASPVLRHAVTEDMVILSELDVPNRRYEKLGEVSATVKRTAAYMPKPMRTLLNDKMRADAFRMGADAVIMIKYELPGVWSKERNYAVGMAVKFQ